MNKKFIIIICLLLAIATGGGFYFISKDNNSSKQDTTKVTISPGDIKFEGYLSKSGADYSMMGWSIKSKNDLRKYDGKYVEVFGTQGDKEYILNLKNIEEKVDPNIKIAEQDIETFGKLTVINNNNKSDIHYKVNDIEIRTNKDILSYIGKEVYVYGHKGQYWTKEKNNIDLLDIEIPYEMVGKFDIKTSDKKHYHYAIDKYDLHSTEDYIKYNGATVKALVVKGQHGQTDDDSKLTLIKLISTK